MPNQEKAPIEHPKDSLLRLPREVLSQVLSYRIRQGDTIYMKEGRVSAERRRWLTEVERLHDPNFKRPKRPEFPAFLLSGKEVYFSAVETFWGGNTFNFTTVGELEQFLKVGTRRAIESVKQIALFHDYSELTVNELHWKAKTDATPFTRWPPSLQALGSFTKLISLDIFTTVFCGHCSHDDMLDELYGATSRNEPRHVRQLYYPFRHCGLYVRDSMLKSIPVSITERLKTLIIRYDTSLFAMAHTSIELPNFPMSRVVDILPYVRDLQSGVWDIMPYPHVETAFQEFNAEQYLANKLWLEARAAAHFNHEVSPPGDAAFVNQPWIVQQQWYDKRLDQWCPWSLDWAIRSHTRESYEWAERRMALQLQPGLVLVPPQRQATPRSFGELFETVDGKVRVKEEHTLDAFLEEHPEEAAIFHVNWYAAQTYKEVCEQHAASKSLPIRENHY